MLFCRAVSSSHRRKSTLLKWKWDCGMPKKNCVAPNFLIFVPLKISVTHFASPGMSLHAPGAVRICALATSLLQLLQLPKPHPASPSRSSIIRHSGGRQSGTPAIEYDSANGHRTVNIIVRLADLLHTVSDQRNHPTLTYTV